MAPRGRPLSLPVCNVFLFDKRDQISALRIYLDRNLAIVKGIEELAAEKRCSAAQLALAWLLARGDDIVPIAGTKRRNYLEQNVGAVQVKLSANDLSRLDRAAPRGAAAGARYPQEAMQRVNI